MFHSILLHFPVIYLVAPVYRMADISSMLLLPIHLDRKLMLMFEFWLVRRSILKGNSKDLKLKIHTIDGIGEILVMKLC
uniref:Secreted protein n=1 Tax=Elaeophora elaphi TaxID=1147741 RepID=A0A0R3RGW5_9BILA